MNKVVVASVDGQYCFPVLRLIFSQVVSGLVQLYNAELWPKKHSYLLYLLTNVACFYADLLMVNIVSLF